MFTSCNILTDWLLNFCIFAGFHLEIILEKVAHNSMILPFATMIFFHFNLK